MNQLDQVRHSLFVLGFDLFAVAVKIFFKRMDLFAQMFDPFAHGRLGLVQRLFQVAVRRLEFLSDGIGVTTLGEVDFSLV